MGILGRIVDHLGHLLDVAGDLVGFAEGQYSNGTYTVRRRDAHAWPEVFFPGLGWVEFEPTTSQNALVRFDPAAQSPNSSAGRGPVARPNEDPNDQAANPSNLAAKPVVPFNQTPAGRALPYVVSLIAAGFAAFLIYRYRVISLMPVALDRAFARSGIATPDWILDWLHWSRLQPVERAFAPVNWSLRWFGKTPPVHASHTERAASLKKLMPLAVEPIDVAASELETGLFTPHAPDVHRARRAAWMILAYYVRTRIAGFLGI